MQRVQLYLDRVRTKLEDEFDRIVIVLGDEGHGKSTFMMQTAWFWQKTLDRDPSIDSTIGCVAWDHDDFKASMATREPYSCIVVHDATRVLSKKKAMRSDQIEIEEDLLDVRQGRYFILLGFQDWAMVPTMLAERRAHDVFRVTTRGRVHAFGRKHIDKRIEKDKWPDPGFVDSFADLSGTQLWDRFKEEDLRRKQSRIEPEKDEGDEEMSIDELVDHIKTNGVQKIINFHEGHHKHRFDPDLIRYEYDVSNSDAKLIKKLLARDLDAEEIAQREAPR